MNDIKPGRKVKRMERIRTIALLWKTFPEAKLGCVGSHFIGDFLCAGVLEFPLENLNNPYMWIDKDFNVVKTGREIKGTIEGYP